MDAASFHLVTRQHTGPASSSLENYTLAQAEKLGEAFVRNRLRCADFCRNQRKIG